MKRYVLESLKKWKNSENRKPLILYGARQTGKTWLMKEFGKICYKQFVYLNFDENQEHKDFFQKNLDTKHIINALSYYFKIEITPEDTLIILDEIQECQRAKDALKYFNENAPEYHIIAAGSFLGVAAGKFPVGKVDEITLYPMSFYEFLEAVGRENLLEAVKEYDRKLLETLSALFFELLRAYFFVGGMPAAVQEYASTQNLGEVRRIQNLILNEYKNDFSKHIKGTDIPKVRMLWDSIPFHLAREKKKFIYKDVKVGGRASEFENAMDWLVQTGLVYKVPRTLEIKLPLSRNEEREVFKLYMNDIGLLCAKADVNLADFYSDNPKIFSDFNGALTEQYVCQELRTSFEKLLFYWGRDKGAAEVDFVMQYKGEIIPIEVKSSYNKRSQSLDVYMDLYKPKIAIKTSLRNIGNEGALHSIPLYLIESLAQIIKEGN
jgi:predicted AAA+ superfamily ATPase